MTNVNLEFCEDMELINELNKRFVYSVFLGFKDIRHDDEFIWSMQGSETGTLGLLERAKLILTTAIINRTNSNEA